MTSFFRAVDAEPYAAAFEAALPILGVDGDLANQGLGTPAVGHVRAKTGTRAAVAPAGLGLIGARTQVGYIDAASGRQLVFSIMVQRALHRLDDLSSVIANVANLLVAIYEAY